MAIPTVLLVSMIVIGCVVQLIYTILGFFGFLGAALGLILLIPLLVLYSIASLLLHYNCWLVLPAGYRKLDPLQASLFLLIPFFNLYWLFVTFPSLGKGFDQCLDSNRLAPGTKKETLGLFYACSVLVELFTSWIPLVSGLTSAIVLIFFLIYYIEIIKSANAIAKMQGKLVKQPSSQVSQDSGYVEQPGTPMQKLLRLAQFHGGQLSPAQISMQMDLEPEAIDRLLQDAQKHGYVEIGNHPNTGAIRYYFDV